MVSRAILGLQQLISHNKKSPANAKGNAQQRCTY